MAIILPPSYPLHGHHVALLTAEQARHADIRPLRIGIINVMPRAEQYEYHLLYPLGKSIIQVEPVWIRLTTHAYKSSNKEHLARYYVPFARAIADQPLDGLIVTGAPVEELAFEEVNYWDELATILRFARSNIASTLGICWGALALAKMLGIEKTIYPMKIFGVYDTKNLDRSHRITGDFDDVFLCPQSRHAGIEDSVLEKAAARNDLHLLAHAEKAGYVIFESADGRYVMHLGHPEYEAERLVREYERDMSLGRKDVQQPINVNLLTPINRWRAHCLDFFGQWMRFLYEKIT